MSKSVCVIVDEDGDIVGVVDSSRMGILDVEDHLRESGREDEGWTAEEFTLTSGDQIQEMLDAGPPSDED